MVHLKEAYSQTSRSEIEFIGIIGHDTAEKVKAYVDQAGILSPQLMADSGNKLLETYGIKSYPTTLLISPDGRVLLTNLRGANLSDVLIRLVRANR